MKRLICGLLITLFGCQTQNNLIDAHFSYKGRFSDYKSFGFMQDNASKNIEEYDQRIIENMIFKRFTAMGYKYDEKMSDLLIAYRYFDEGTDLVTMRQGSLKDWVGNKTYTPESEFYEPHRETNENGTLSVYILDAARGEIIFQAYYKDYQQEQSDYMIISSVGRMLDKYQVTSF